MTANDPREPVDGRRQEVSGAFIAALIREEVACDSLDTLPPAAPGTHDAPLDASDENATRREWSLDELSAPVHPLFADHAYMALVGRQPTPAERETMYDALRRGDTKTWLLGRLRFGREGRAREIAVRGLRARYIVQRLIRVPGLGLLVEWVVAIARLPRSARYLRAVDQNLSERATRIEAHVTRTEAQVARTEAQAARTEEQVTRIEAQAAGTEEQVARTEAQVTRIEAQAARTEAQVARTEAQVTRIEAQAARTEEQVARIEAQAARTEEQVARTEAHVARADERIRATVADCRTELLGQFDPRLTALEQEAARVSSTLRGEIDALREQAERIRLTQDEGESRAARAADDRIRIEARLDRIVPSHIPETLEVEGESLLRLARARMGIAPDVPASSLSADERYALFESVFYESTVVLDKQRIYLPYLDRTLASALPFLDLGCGRGEFMQILREEGVDSVGVDVNGLVIERLKARGFDAVHRDLIDFLRRDRRRFCGASALQVVERLSHEQVEQMLALLFPRLAGGAVLILETPNPLSPFALGHFHTDPTHVAPLPPERLRFAAELAGFEATRTLYQGRIPGDQFAGPDPVAHFVDYAIIAYKRA